MMGCPGDQQIRNSNHHAMIANAHHRGRFKGRTLPDRRARASGRRPTGCARRCSTCCGDRVDGARVLDGFAGTGAVGLEALSRGATRATFVERDRGALAVLRHNIGACGVAADCDVIPADMLTLGQRGPAPGPFEFVFLDPPYDEPALDADGHEGGAVGECLRSAGARAQQATCVAGAGWSARSLRGFSRRATVRCRSTARSAR